VASVVVGRAVSVGFGAVGRGSDGGLGVAVVGDGVHFHTAFYSSHSGLLWWKAGFCSSLGDDFGFPFAVGGFGFFEDGEELLAGANNFARLVNDRDGLAEASSWRRHGGRRGY